MRRQKPAVHPPWPWPGPVPHQHEHPSGWFPTSDLVLLCSFGDHPEAEQTSQQLRGALLAAGFPPHVARHLIGLSRLLRRCARGRYQIRPFER